MFKIKFENNRRNRSNLALLYMAAFFIILSYFYRINYIEYALIRSLYIPIIGISMLAIMLDYLVFGHVFLVCSLFGLILGYARSVSTGANETAINSIIIIFGLIFGFLLQMYIKYKNK